MRVLVCVCRYIYIYIFTSKYSCDVLPQFVSFSICHNGVSHIQIMLLAPVCSKNFPRPPKHARSIAAFGYNRGCKAPGKKKCELSGMANRYCYTDVFVPHCHCISVGLMRAPVKLCHAKTSNT